MYQFSDVVDDTPPTPTSPTNATQPRATSGLPLRQLSFRSQKRAQASGSPTGADDGTSENQRGEDKNEFDTQQQQHLRAEGAENHNNQSSSQFEMKEMRASTSHPPILMGSASDGGSSSVFGGSPTPSMRNAVTSQSRSNSSSRIHMQATMSPKSGQHNSLHPRLEDEHQEAADHDGDDHRNNNGTNDDDGNVSDSTTLASQSTQPAAGGGGGGLRSRGARSKSSTSTTTAQHHHHHHDKSAQQSSSASKPQIGQVADVSSSFFPTAGFFGSGMSEAGSAASSRQASMYGRSGNRSQSSNNENNTNRGAAAAATMTMQQQHHQSQHHQQHNHLSNQHLYPTRSGAANSSFNGRFMSTTPAAGNVLPRDFSEMSSFLPHTGSSLSFSGGTSSTIVDNSVFAWIVRCSLTSAMPVPELNIFLTESLRFIDRLVARAAEISLGAEQQQQAGASAGDGDDGDDHHHHRDVSEGEHNNKTMSNSSSRQGSDRQKSSSFTNKSSPTQQKQQSPATSFGRTKRSTTLTPQQQTSFLPTTAAFGGGGGAGNIILPPMSDDDADDNNDNNDAAGDESGADEQQDDARFRGIGTRVESRRASVVGSPASNEDGLSPPSPPSLLESPRGINDNQKQQQQQQQNNNHHHSSLIVGPNDDPNEEVLYNQITVFFDMAKKIPPGSFRDCITGFEDPIMANSVRALAQLWEDSFIHKRELQALLSMKHQWQLLSRSAGTVAQQARSRFVDLPESRFGNPISEVDSLPGILASALAVCLVGVAALFFINSYVVLSDVSSSSSTAHNAVVAFFIILLIMCFVLLVTVYRKYANTKFQMRSILWTVLCADAMIWNHQQQQQINQNQQQGDESSGEDDGGPSEMMDRGGGGGMTPPTTSALAPTVSISAAHNHGSNSNFDSRPEPRRPGATSLSPVGPTTSSAQQMQSLKAGGGSGSGGGTHATTSNNNRRISNVQFLTSEGTFGDAMSQASFDNNSNNYDTATSGSGGVQRQNSNEQQQQQRSPHGSGGGGGGGRGGYNFFSAGGAAAVLGGGGGSGGRLPHRSQRRQQQQQQQQQQYTTSGGTTTASSAAATAANQQLAFVSNEWLKMMPGGVLLLPGRPNQQQSSLLTPSASLGIDQSSVVLPLSSEPRGGVGASSYSATTSRSASRQSLLSNQLHHPHRRGSLGGGGGGSFDSFHGGAGASSASTSPFAPSSSLVPPPSPPASISLCLDMVNIHRLLFIVCFDFNFVVQQWNEGAEELTGFLSRECVGKKLKELIAVPSDIISNISGGGESTPPNASSSKRSSSSAPRPPPAPPVSQTFENVYVSVQSMHTGTSVLRGSFIPTYDADSLLVSSSSSSTSSSQHHHRHSSAFTTSASFPFSTLGGSSERKRSDPTGFAFVSAIQTENTSRASSLVLNFRTALLRQTIEAVSIECRSALRNISLSQAKTQLAENMAVKVYRDEMERGVNTSDNALSPVAMAHMLRYIQSLRVLVRGSSWEQITAAAQNVQDDWEVLSPEQILSSAVRYNLNKVVETRCGGGNYELPKDLRVSRDTAKITKAMVSACPDKCRVLVYGEEASRRNRRLIISVESVSPASVANPVLMSSQGSNFGSGDQSGGAGLLSSGGSRSSGGHQQDTRGMLMSSTDSVLSTTPPGLQNPRHHHHHHQRRQSNTSNRSQQQDKNESSTATARTTSESGGGNDTVKSNLSVTVAPPPSSVTSPNSDQQQQQNTTGDDENENSNMLARSDGNVFGEADLKSSPPPNSGGAGGAGSGMIINNLDVEALSNMPPAVSHEFSSEHEVGTATKEFVRTLSITSTTSSGGMTPAAIGEGSGSGSGSGGGDEAASVTASPQQSAAALAKRSRLRKQQQALGGTPVSSLDNTTTNTVRSSSGDQQQNVNNSSSSSRRIANRQPRAREFDFDALFQNVHQWLLSAGGVLVPSSDNMCVMLYLPCISSKNFVEGPPAPASMMMMTHNPDGSPTAGAAASSQHAGASGSSSSGFGAAQSSPQIEITRASERNVFDFSNNNSRSGDPLVQNVSSGSYVIDLQHQNQGGAGASSSSSPATAAAAAAAAAGYGGGMFVSSPQHNLSSCNNLKGAGSFAGFGEPPRADTALANTLLAEATTVTTKCPISVAMLFDNAVDVHNLTTYLFSIKGVSVSVCQTETDLLARLPFVDLIFVDLDIIPEIEAKKPENLKKQLFVLPCVPAEWEPPEDEYGNRTMESQVIMRPFDKDLIMDKVVEASELVLSNREKDQQDLERNRIFQARNDAPWTRGRLLGKGSFGTVYEGKNDMTGGVMAVKCFDLRTMRERASMDSDPDAYEKIISSMTNEIAILCKLSHQNVVHYFYCEQTEHSLNLFMELCERSLQDIINSRRLNRGRLEAAAPTIARQVLQAVAYLHERGVIHRDLKPGNILLRGDLIKLTDFGTAAQLSSPAEQLTETQGTFRFMAPEVFHGKNYSASCDIWSLGCIMAELLHLDLSFMDPSNHMALADALLADNNNNGGGGGGENNHNNSNSTNNQHENSVTDNSLILKVNSNFVNLPPVSHSFSADARDFVSLCLQVRAEDRPLASALLLHPYVDLGQIGEETVMLSQLKGGERRQSSSSSRPHQQQSVLATSSAAPAPPAIPPRSTSSPTASSSRRRDDFHEGLRRSSVTSSLGGGGGGPFSGMNSVRASVDDVFAPPPLASITAGGGAKVVVVQQPPALSPLRQSKDSNNSSNNNYHGIATSMMKIADEGAHDDNDDDGGDGANVVIHSNVSSMPPSPNKQAVVNNARAQQQQQQQQQQQETSSASQPRHHHHHRHQHQHRSPARTSSGSGSGGASSSSSQQRGVSASVGGKSTTTTSNSSGSRGSGGSGGGGAFNNVQSINVQSSFMSVPSGSQHEQQPQQQSQLSSSVPVPPALLPLGRDLSGFSVQSAEGSN